MPKEVILTQDPKNFNKHSEFGMRLLEKSMRKNGFVEAGVISEDGVICGGNEIKYPSTETLKVLLPL